MPARPRVARVLFLMLDGVGAGELPDAAAFGVVGADTLGNLSRLVDLQLPNLRALGLGNLHPLRGVTPVAHPLALPGRLTELSAGKDTTNGHWEHMGLVTTQPFPTYPDGFPEEVLQPFRERIGRDVLGNKAASGTEIIAELGGEHVATGRPIVYTSADSVFQIACHVEVIPLEELYRYCAIARQILHGPHAVARVIARPFAGSKRSKGRPPRGGGSPVRWANAVAPV
ncbi:MAG: phosphopentomutase, partial [Thermoleophilia bacterium]|nr:phosphopentomutase [Thermoleophilia bacterium]